MLQQIKTYSVIIPVLLTVIALSLIILIPTAAAYTNYISDKKLSPIYEVNTRVKDISFYAPALVNFTLTKFGSGCLDKIAIYVHGYNRDDGEAKRNLIEYKHH